MSQFLQLLKKSADLWAEMNTGSCGRREFHEKLLETRRMLAAADKILKVANRKEPTDCVFQGCWEPGTAEHQTANDPVWLCSLHSATSSWPKVVRSTTGGRK